MCGIAGMFGRADRDTLETMLDALAHRGPDDGHLVCGHRFALGARRLSILDLEHGRQPMSDEVGKVWAVQNGELYNFPELRSTLCRQGHHLRSQCDTEVLPHLYEEHGVALPEQIDGMFAVAIWDDRRQQGLLVRDRMGKKPLYYHLREGVLYFASEIKALLRIPGIERRLNLEALHHFLGYKHVPHPMTIFADIHQLPPASALLFRPGSTPRLWRYWEIPTEEDAELASGPEEELVERLLHLLRKGVKRRLLADVPVGFFLSGGLDSSLSTALAAEMSPGRLKTFTLAYREDATTPGKEEDRRWARWVAREYGTEHHEETIDSSNLPETFQKALCAFDEPFSGVISTYYLARLISQEVKVAVAGDGADELFGSYLSHRLAFPLANWARYRQTGDSSLIRPFEKNPDFLAGLVARNDWSWRARLLVFSEEDKASLYRPEVAHALAGCSTRDHLREAFTGLERNDPLNRILKAEFRTLFPDQVLAFVDRLSMAHSLEVRSAFLDTDVVSFAARLPGQWKIRAGETKYLLKRAALRFFPEEMVHRPKEGFVMPINTWLVRGLESYVRQTLSQGSLDSHGLFNSAEVQRLVDALYAGQTQYANKVLSLLAFQQWYDIYRPSIPTGQGVQDRWADSVCA